MNKLVLSSLAAAMAVGCVQAQDASVQAALASQQAQINQLQKQIAAGPSIGSFRFPKELQPYIVVEASLVSTSNNTAAGQNKIDIPTQPWFSANRWGLRGTLNTFSPDTDLIYKLETGFGIADGGLQTTNVVTAASPAGTTPTNAGTEAVLFNRDAWLGFMSKTIGQVTIGRQNTLARDFSETYGDAFGTPGIVYEELGWTNQNNFKDLVNFAGSVDGSRMNKGIVWKKITESGLSMGLAYNLADYSLTTPYANNVTQANTSTRDTTGCAALGYNAKLFNVSGYYTLANQAGFTQKSYSLGGDITPTAAIKVNAGAFRYLADQGPVNGHRTDTAFVVSASYSPSDVWNYFLGYQAWQANHAGLSKVGGNMTMPFSNGFIAPAGAIGSGNRNTTYMAVRRYLNKRADVYLAADYEQLTNAYKLSATNGFHEQTEFAVGLRIKAL